MQRGSRYSWILFAAVVLCVTGQDQFKNARAYIEEMPPQMDLGKDQLCIIGEPTKSFCINGFKKVVQDKFHKDLHLTIEGEPVCIFYPDSLDWGAPLFAKPPPYGITFDTGSTSCAIHGTCLDKQSGKRTTFNYEFFNAGGGIHAKVRYGPAP